MKITLPIFVVAFETDFGGVVSNTRYVEYLERGRYALLGAAGLKITDIWNEHGVQPIVRRVTVDYLVPAQHEDELELIAWVGEHSGATTLLHFECVRPRDAATIMRAEQTLAYLNTRWKPVRVPTIFRDALAVDNHRDTEAPR
ncbi:MAG: thioesterase family protein [Abitibacteriaceae bacterium]|nr:thioesterase family protein [Abditibacteriaceae bacterium]MBV9866941.1 thioesterase family protein [Abditibacteriaceae bacterium]